MRLLFTSHGQQRTEVHLSEFQVHVVQEQELSSDVRIHSLPANLREATLAMSESDFMKEAVGSHIFERYTSAKMDEWNEYTRQVTDWEISNYLYKV